jgi:hypothetical protein
MIRASLSQIATPAEKSTGGGVTERQGLKFWNPTYLAE